jgi:hypothetical protein
MNVSIELENEARQTYAVFVDGCLHRPIFAKGRSKQGQAASHQRRGRKASPELGSWACFSSAYGVPDNKERPSRDGSH